MILNYNIEIDEEKTSTLFLPSWPSIQFVNATIEDIIRNISIGHNYINMLDYGCGCGYIGLAVAKNISEAKNATLYDIDNHAIEVSKFHADLNKCKDVIVTNSLTENNEFTNICFFQPQMSESEWEKKIEEGEKLYPKEAYVLTDDTIQNFADYCSRNIYKKHYLILLKWSDSEQFLKIRDIFYKALPGCFINMEQHETCKFIAIRNERILI